MIAVINSKQLPVLDKINISSVNNCQMNIFPSQCFSIHDGYTNANPHAPVVNIELYGDYSLSFVYCTGQQKVNCTVNSVVHCSIYTKHIAQ